MPAGDPPQSQIDTRALEKAITAEALIRQHIDDCAAQRREAREDMRGLMAEIRSRHGQLRAQVDAKAGESRALLLRILFIAGGIIAALIAQLLGWK